MFIIPAADDSIELPWLTRLSRRLFGKDEIPRGVPQEQMEVLEQAYYLERIRNFDSALVGYGQLFEMPASTTLKEAVALHQAYCYLETGDYEKATSLCRQLSEEGTLREVRTTARAIENFIVKLNNVIKGHLSRDASILERGLHYYFTLQYQKTIDLFEPALENPEGLTNDEVEKMRYFVARAKEALGMVGEAVREYKRLFVLNPESPWAVESARRSVMLDVFYDVDAPGLDAAHELLESIDDPVLDALAHGDIFIPSDMPRPDADEILEAQMIGAEVYVTSDPSRALVTVDGAQVGHTPLYVSELPPGTVEVQVSMGREIRTEEVQLQADSLLALHFDISSSRAALLIDSDIQVDSVSLGGTSLGLNPDHYWDDLPEGEHVLTITGVSPDGTVLLREELITLEKGVLEIPFP